MFVVISPGYDKWLENNLKRIKSLRCNILQILNVKTWLKVASPTLQAQLGDTLGGYTILSETTKTRWHLRFISYACRQYKARKSLIVYWSKFIIGTATLCLLCHLYAAVWVGITYKDMDQNNIYLKYFLFCYVCMKVLQYISSFNRAFKREYNYHNF